MIEYGVEEVDINQSYKSSAREWCNRQSQSFPQNEHSSSLKISWAVEGSNAQGTAAMS